MSAAIIVFLCCAVFGSLCFALAYIGFLFGGRASSSTGMESDVPPLTIIVAARNEAGRMPALLAHIAAQDYPLEKMRVILADDGSTDCTAEAAESAASKGLSLSVLCIRDTPAGVSHKKWALDTAIRKAGTEFLLFTDADCRPEPRWARSMADSLAKADCVIGVSPMERRRGIAARYTGYETWRTALLYIGAAGLRLPYMAAGRNWGYRASLYSTSGGLQSTFDVLGGDDDLLLQRFAEFGARIRTVTAPGSICRTDPPFSLASLFRQKLRHYSVSYRYPPKAKIILALFGAAQFVSIVVAPVYFAWDSIRLPVWGIVACKLLIDTNWIRCFSQKLDSDRRPATGALERMFLELFHTCFSSVTGLLSYFARPRW